MSDEPKFGQLTEEQRENIREHRPLTPGATDHEIAEAFVYGCGNALHDGAATMQLEGILVQVREAGLREGVRRERARVVAWLRDVARGLEGSQFEHGSLPNHTLELSNALEDGDHDHDDHAKTEGGGEG